MKKLVGLALIVVLMLGLMAPIMSAATVVTVMVNNNKISFPDQQPYIDTNNRTLVPVRFVSEALSASVNWEAASQTVGINQGSKSITLKIGENKAIVSGQTKTFDTKAVLNNGRTMVPLRFVSEVLGATVVEWVAKTNTVKITVNNGYTLPENPKVGVNIYPKDDPAKLDCRIAVVTYEEMEPQFKEAHTILASKFGDDKAKEIVDYTRRKKTWRDEIAPQYWTINNQLIEVISKAGYESVIINIWQPGVKI